MKKRYLCFGFVLVGLMCFLSANTYAEGEEPEAPKEIINEVQKDTIIDHCDTIKDNLKSVQRADSRTRVYLGRYYETILSNFITPLNLRLVENNISDAKLLDNQTNFAARRERFNSDFIVYQQVLEELVNINCKNEPVRFYEKLEVVREKRQTVNRDVTKLREMTGEQVKLVEALKNGIE